MSFTVTIDVDRDFDEVVPDQVSPDAYAESVKNGVLMGAPHLDDEDVTVTVTGDGWEVSSLESD